MDTPKNMAKKLVDSEAHSTPNSSSPLRRRTVLPQRQPIFSLSENDDEAERLARRRTIDTSTTPVQTNDKRRSLGYGVLAQMPPSQMVERISQCIKLGTENKINPKNAFTLEIIDFMSYMVKRKDANMSNLQIASTSLDVSTKIYGFRVDGVHMEILKMIDGLGKQEKMNDNTTQNNVEHTNTEQPSESTQKKRKKARTQIFNTIEALRASVEIARPSLMTTEGADMQSTDTLYQAMLPNHANCGFYHHIYNDVIVDTVAHKEIQDGSLETTVPKIRTFSFMEMCPPLFNFDFQSWNADDEPDDMVNLDDSNKSRFQFDFDADLPANDGSMPTGMDYFDIQDEEENIDKCIRAPNQLENIVDFRNVLTTTAPPVKVSEYSFLQKSLNVHWAGPSHWKINNFKKPFNNSRIVGTCQQVAVRKKKEIQLFYDEETKKAMESKFVHSHGVKLQAKTAKLEWSEEKVTLPPDEHYDIKDANKLYLHSLLSVNLGHENTIDPIHSSDDNYVCDSDNDIQNFTSHDNNNEDNLSQNDEIQANCIRSENDEIFGSQIPLTGSNLVTAPKLTSKTCIAYSIRARKIDMRQLKKSIWKGLTSTCDDKENMDIQVAVSQEITNKMSSTKVFDTVYKMLPKTLSKTNSEALNFPISFVSLLHLANEKTLKISSTPDMSNLIVEQN